MLRIIGCDVGIVHLGLAVIESSLGKAARVAATHLECVDVTVYTHDHLDEDRCGLPHTKELGDRVMHAVAERRPLFDQCDAVVIERQPPNGHQAVQALLHQAFREKAVLVHPAHLHRHHRDNHGLEAGSDYDQRKAHFERWAADLVGPEEWERRTRRFPRRHDIADALAIAELYGSAMRDKHQRVLEHQRRRAGWSDAARDGFAQYRYRGDDEEPQQ